MMWQIEWYYCYVPGGYPGVGLRPHNFTYDLISQKPYRSPPINHIYSYSSWCAALNVLLWCPQVLVHIIDNITEFRNDIEAIGDGKPGFVTIPVTSCYRVMAPLFIFYQSLIFQHSCQMRGPDSVVESALNCESGGPGFAPRWRRHCCIRNEHEPKPLILK